MPNLQIDGIVKVDSDNLQKLCAERDVFGNTISVGDVVRSHDFPFWFDNDPTDVKIDGLQTTGIRANYLLGRVTEIGKVEIEGCPRYTIVYTEQVSGGKSSVVEESLAYPPVNGIPTTMGKVTAGVVRQEDVLS